MIPDPRSYRPEKSNSELTVIMVVSSATVGVKQNVSLSVDLFGGDRIKAEG